VGVNLNGSRAANRDKLLRHLNNCHCRVWRSVTGAPQMVVAVRVSEEFRLSHRYVDKKMGSLFFSRSGRLEWPVRVFPDDSSRIKGEKYDHRCLKCLHLYKKELSSSEYVTSQPVL